MRAETPIKKKYPVLNVILYSLIGLILVLAAVSCYLYWNRKPLLTHYLQKKITKGTDSLYHIKFSELNFSLFSGNVQVKNLELIPDTATYNKFIALKKAPDNLFHVKIKELNILNIAVSTALFQKKLSVDSIKIDQPELTVVNKNQPYNDTVKKENPQNLYPLIKKVFKKVEIKDISLTNSTFELTDKNSKEVEHTALDHVNIDVKEVLIDSLSGKDKSRFYSSKSMALRLSNYKLATSDSLYYLTVKDLSFSTQKHQLLLNNIAFTPRYSKSGFYEKVKLSKDRYDLKFNTVSINDIDLQRLVNKQQFFSSSANISNADIEVYNNNAYPNDKSEKPHWDNFPHQQLQKVAAELKIDTLNLKNINVIYAEADKGSKQTGSISFNNISGQILNITNDSLAKVNNKYATARLTTRILNAADLTAQFKFDLASKNGAFSFLGELGALNGVIFNQITVPLGMVKINSLAIQRLTFSSTADDYHASGQMKLYYTNLNLELLKKKKGEKQLDKKGFISALANMFIIKSDNPDKNNNFRTGLINYKRPIKILFFNFLWKSLFTGIKSSAGLSAKKDTEQVDTTVSKKTNLIEKIGSFLGVSDEKRKERQERRQQKKAAKHKK